MPEDLDTRSTITVYTLQPENFQGAAKFQACWLADISQSLMMINIGEIHVVGPEVFQEAFECVLGSPCVIGVSGFRLKRNKNRLGIFENEDCNVNPTPYDFGPWFENPSVSGFNVDAAIDKGWLKSYDDVEFKPGAYANSKTDS